VKNLNTFPVLFWLKIRLKILKENLWLVQRVLWRSKRCIIDLRIFFFRFPKLIFFESQNPLILDSYILCVCSMPLPKGLGLNLPRTCLQRRLMWSIQADTARGLVLHSSAQILSVVVRSHTYIACVDVIWRHSEILRKKVLGPTFFFSQFNSCYIGAYLLCVSMCISLSQPH
jgi:hypothetical protein